MVTTVELEGNSVQEFLNLGKNQFNIKVKIIDNELKQSKVTNKKLKNDFLALTTDIKSKLSKSYTAEEAKKTYFNSKR